MESIASLDSLLYPKENELSGSRNSERNIRAFSSSKYDELYNVLANKSIYCKPLSIIQLSYDLSHFYLLTIDPIVEKTPLNANFTIEGNLVKAIFSRMAK